MGHWLEICDNITLWTYQIQHLLQKMKKIVHNAIKVKPLLFIHFAGVDSQSVLTFYLVVYVVTCKSAILL